MLGLINIAIFGKASDYERPWNSNLEKVVIERFDILDISMSISTPN